MSRITKALTLLGLVGCSYTFEVEFGGGFQQEQFRGWIQYKGDKVDVKNDLHIRSKVKGFGFINIRHKAKLGFIPLPDLKIEYLAMKSDGYGRVNKTFTFGVVTITASDRVYSKFKFNQWDITAYYTPLKVKNILFASWGLGVKVIDFYAYVRSETTGQSDSKSATIPLPYLYGKVGAELKFVHAYAEGKAIAADSKDYFYDVKGAVGLHYDINKTLRISLEGGYRLQRYRVNDVSDISADVRAKGGFGDLALTLRF